MPISPPYQMGYLFNFESCQRGETWNIELKYYSKQIKILAKSWLRSESGLKPATPWTHAKLSQLMAGKETGI